jgi:hypothetical protein
MFSEHKELGNSRLSIPTIPAFTRSEIYIDPFQQQQQLLLLLPMTKKIGKIFTFFSECLLRDLAKTIKNFS